MTLFELCKNVIGNSLANFGTTLDGKSCDIAEFNLTRRLTVFEQMTKHTLRLGCNNGADAVTAADTDNDFVEVVIIDKVAVCLDTLNSFELFSHNCGKFFGCRLNNFFHFYFLAFNYLQVLRRPPQRIIFF